MNVPHSDITCTACDEAVKLTPRTPQGTALLARETAGLPRSEDGVLVSWATAGYIVSVAQLEGLRVRPARPPRNRRRGRHNVPSAASAQLAQWADDGGRP